MRRRAVLFAPLLPWPALAQGAWPVRSVRMVVPFAAGGSADVVARLIAVGLQEQLGQPVVVENRGGSGGVIGSEAALTAPSDGYTVVFHTLSSAVINAALYPKLAFDMRASFVPVALLGTLPNVVMVTQKLPARTLPELLALMRTAPGRITYASSGAGTITHLSAHMLAMMAGAQATHVPYRGSGPAFADLLAGNVDMMVDTISTTIAPIKAGQVRGLAVTSATRAAALPDLPTVEEAGLPGYVTENWHGIFATAGTPAPVIARLEAASQAAVASQRARLLDAGLAPRTETGATFGAFWDAELTRWLPIVRSSGATPD